MYANNIYNVHNIQHRQVPYTTPYLYFTVISLVNGQECAYRQNNYCSSCSKDGLSMSFWKIMNGLQSKRKSHCTSKSYSRAQSEQLRHGIIEYATGKK